MPRRQAPSLLGALLVLALLLAGCAAEPAAPEAAASAAIVITDVNDVEALTNESFQMQAHLHDYWGGMDRLVVMDATEAGEVFFVSPKWDFELRPEPGLVVPQGTAAVDITVSWIDGSNKQYTSPELWVRTAADHEPLLIGPVTQGETIRVPTLLANADLPHQTLSAWRFIWQIHPNPANLIWWDGELTMKVEAVRGLEIPVYPPHPDLWSGKSALALLDDGQPVGAWGGNPATGASCYGQCAPIHRPANGSTVPYDATLVEVALELQEPAPTQLGLQFHGADTRDWTELQPTRVEGQVRYYEIPLTAGMGDSPYATQSIWEFAPVVEAPIKDSLKVGAYTITARVLRD